MNIGAKARFVVTTDRDMCVFCKDLYTYIHIYTIFLYAINITRILKVIPIEHIIPFPLCKWEQSVM